MLLEVTVFFFFLCFFFFFFTEGVPQADNYLNRICSLVLYLLVSGKAYEGDHEFSLNCLIGKGQERYPQHLEACMLLSHCLICMLGIVSYTKLT